MPSDLYVSHSYATSGEEYLWVVLLSLYCSNVSWLHRRENKQFGGLQHPRLHHSQAPHSYSVDHLPTYPSSTVWGLVLPGDCPLHSTAALNQPGPWQLPVRASFRSAVPQPLGGGFVQQERRAIRKKREACSVLSLHKTPFQWLQLCAPRGSWSMELPERKAAIQTPQPPPFWLLCTPVSPMSIEPQGLCSTSLSHPLSPKNKNTQGCRGSHIPH